MENKNKYKIIILVAVAVLIAFLVWDFFVADNSGDNPKQSVLVFNSSTSPAIGTVATSTSQNHPVYFCPVVVPMGTSTSLVLMDLNTKDCPAAYPIYYFEASAVLPLTK